MADLREANDQVQSKAGEVASLENQLHRAQEQLKAARAESSELLAAPQGWPVRTLFATTMQAQRRPQPLTLLFCCYRT